MNIRFQILFILGLQLLSVAGYAQPVHVKTLTYATAASKSRLIFNVSASPKHRVFVLDKPARLVIDIANAVLDNNPSQPAVSHPLFAKVRAATKNADGLRVVIDLKSPVGPQNFSLMTNNKDGHRLVVDLINKTPLAKTNPNTVKTNQTVLTAVESAGNPRAKKEKNRSADNAIAINASKADKLVQVAKNQLAGAKGKRFIVAIDAGHGGDDPGAHGPQGTEEKAITFAIAKKLAALINAQPGMKAAMIRTGDYYIGLRKRMQLARDAKADLFVSIHADAFADASVRGASVYTLSTRGASSEAAHWLADSENASEVGGVSLSDKEDVLASVLLDLSQTATQQASNKLAGCVLRKFQSISDLHKDSVQNAGFIVLKSPDIPSILVETAFISNPLEEQNLLSARYQAKTANAIYLGVLDYLNSTAPVESRIAALAEN